jgi:hypothetical protein
MQAMGVVSVEFRTTGPMPDNSFFGCEVINLVRTLSGDNMLNLNTGVPLLRLDDEPPDPGDLIVQLQDYDRSVKAGEDEAMPELEDFVPNDNTQIVHVQPLSVMLEPAPSNSSEMISAWRSLNSHVLTVNTTDTVMANSTSILGKRSACQTVPRLEKALLLHMEGGTGTLQTYGKTKKGYSNTDDRGETDRTDVVASKVILEATSPGAAGELTGPHGAARQEQ